MCGVHSCVQAQVRFTGASAKLASVVEALGLGE